MTLRFGFLKTRFSLSAREFRRWLSSALPAEVAEGMGLAPSTSNDSGPVSQGKPAAIGSDDRGLASVEYVIVLVAVSIGVAASLVVIGSTVVDSFEWQVGILGLPVP